MPITNDMLELERPHALNGTPGFNGSGVQRIYKLPNGFQLSAVNHPGLHSYPYAWEIAVANRAGRLVYDTPLTEDVEVFMSDDEAKAFIERAKQWALENPDA